MYTMEDNKLSQLPANRQDNMAYLTKSYEALSTFQEMKEFAEELVAMESKLVPFKKAGDVLIVLQAARDFKIPLSFALANIHPIQGKASAGIHLMAAQILNAGITYKVIEDFQPVYQFKGQGGIMVTQDEYFNNPERFNLIGPKTPTKDYHPDKINVIRTSNIIDYRTVIEFTRQVKQPDGSFKEMVIYGKFSRSDAVKAGLYESKPDTWGRYERPMVYARAFADGSHKIGDDVLLGMTEVSMLCDVYDIPYRTDDQGNIVPNLSKAKIISNNSNTEEAEATIVD